ncbi:hypothetical protein NDR86_32945 [Nocardia sp. CDC141]|uniref:Uncharacterized protein n=1 Tax=Nocardia pulmonis TaxID=2951408 RepID=A0A9X2EHS7_9NOCA|nr:hypothetical protein [Nocardia sp. CDC159]MCM6778306.1 hypothetical protein [Nocardia pulmonis]
MLAVFFGAPVCAEYLYAYLSFTGDALRMLGGVLFLGPLYGGAALLIREIVVRTHRGWGATLLLAAGFGIAMPGVVDLSLFAEHSSEVAYWDELRLPTLVEPLGISMYNTVMYVTLHVLMSIGAPLALLAVLAPDHRGRPLVGRTGIAVLLALWLTTATMVHFHGRRSYGYTPNLLQVASILTAVAILIALARTPLGRPARSQATTRRIPPAVPLSIGVIAMVLLALVPPTWLGLVAMLTLLLTASGVIAWLSRTRSWTNYEIGALAAGSLVGQTIMGFLTPIPEGVSAAAKYTSSTVLLTLAIALTWAVLHPRRQPPANAARPAPI